ncbi:hypothetical protein QBC42DRAFT_278793, partial [Cladorrhinum samala]
MTTYIHTSVLLLKQHIAMTRVFSLFLFFFFHSSFMPYLYKGRGQKSDTQDEPRRRSSLYHSIYPPLRLFTFLYIYIYIFIFIFILGEPTSHDSL